MITTRIGRPGISSKIVYDPQGKYNKVHFSGVIPQFQTSSLIFDIEQLLDLGSQKPLFIYTTFTGGELDGYTAPDGCNGETIWAYWSRNDGVGSDTVCGVYGFPFETEFDGFIEDQFPSPSRNWELVVYDNDRPRREVSGYFIVENI